MESMTHNTNAYAALKTSEHLQEGGRNWKEVSTLELSIWLGIVVYMRVHNSPTIGDIMDLTQHIQFLNVWVKLDLK